MQKIGKVLFVIHDLYQNDNHFPLGTAYLASALIAKGHEVVVYDQAINHYTNDQLADFLENNEFDLIGLGFMAARFNLTVLELTGIINRHKKNAWLVLGGHGPSPIPEYMLETTGAEIIAMGEGEEVLPEILECKLSEGTLQDKLRIAGIAFMQEGHVYVNPRRSPVKDLDSLVPPAFELFDMNEYTTCLNFLVEDSRDKVFAIATSRGCIGKCNFCYRLEKGLRFRSTEKVADEIEFLQSRYGVNALFMQDELFVSSKKRLLEFSNILKKRDIKIKFTCDARVDIMDEELVDILADMGCKFINFGMESSDDNVLKIMGKQTTLAQNIKAAEIVKKAGIGIGLNFLWGNIGDTATSLKDNVSLIKQYHTFSQVRTIRPPTPYPGCPLYYHSIETGKLNGPGDFFMKFKNSDLMTVNFTEMDDNSFYELLYQANSDLVDFYYENTNKDFEAANLLKSSFYNLYFKGDTSFKGARIYSRKK